MHKITIYILFLFQYFSDYKICFKKTAYNQSFLSINLSFSQYFHRKAALRNRRSSDDMGPIAMGLDDDDNGGMFFHNDDHEDDAELENSNHIPHAHVVEMNHISNLGTRFRNSRTNLLLVNMKNEF